MKLFDQLVKETKELNLNSAMVLIYVVFNTCFVNE